MPEIPCELQEKLIELHNWREYWDARQRRIIELVESGLTYAQVAELVGLTRQRVAIVYRKQRPDAPRRKPGRKPANIAG